MGIGSERTKSTSELSGGPTGRPPSPPGSVPLMRRGLPCPPMHLEECKCCPYGFHIDLDFVQYTEDVATGHYRKHLRQLKKAKKKMRKSMELFLQQNPETTNPRGSVYDNGRGSMDSTPEQDTSLDRSGALSPLESIFSDSLENVMSDFEETFSSQSVPKHRSRDKDYTSDVEVVSRGRVGLERNGYQSDYGYAVPSLNRNQLPQSAPAYNHNPPGHTSYYHQLRPKVGEEMDTKPSPNKPLTSILKRHQPSANDDISPARRMARSDYMMRPSGYSSDYAAPSDLAEMSDSVSSVSSVSSARNLSSIRARGLQKVPYRGLSGQIASNLDTLASALTQKDRSSSLRSASETLLRGHNPAKPPSSNNAAFDAMREHMAVSVSYMQDLEEQVKAVPMLNTRIDSLKRERERLVHQLDKAKELERLKMMEEEALKKKLAEQSPPETPWATSPSLPHYKRPQPQSSSTSEKRPPPPAPPRSDSVGRMRDSTLSPPPVPPKPPIRNSSNNKTALIRTTSGNIMNMEAFSSVKRTSNLDLSASPLIRSRSSHSYRRSSEDDCVSDSEIALGDRTLDRHASLRRSKRILAELGSRTELKQPSRIEDVMSDTEDYYSISYSAERKPKTLYSYANQLNVNEDDAFRQQLIKWREEFEATSVKDDLPVLNKKFNVDVNGNENIAASNRSVLKRDIGLMHSPTTRNAQVETVKEDVKTEAKILHIQSPCEKCSARTASCSIGVGTAPLPMPKPNQSLEAEIERLKEDLRKALERPTSFTVGCSTEGSQGLNRPSRPTMTDAPSLVSTACMTTAQNKPSTASAVTQTGEGRFWTLEIGTMTDRVSWNTCAVNTEDKLFRHAGTSHDRRILVENGNIQEVGVNTEKTRGLSIAVGTDNNVDSKVDKCDMYTDTDLLDLDGILDELSEQRQQIPNLIVQLRNASHAAQPPIKSVVTANKMCNTVSVVSVSQMVATDNVPSYSKAMNTDGLVEKKLVTRDAGLCTEPVRIVSSVTNTAGTCTERIRQRSLYVATEKLDVISKATDTNVRTVDAAASCTLLEDHEEESRASVVDRGCSEDRVDTAVFVTGPPVAAKPIFLQPAPVETNDFSVQAELEPEFQPESINATTFEVSDVERDYGGPWPPVARINVGCGEESIHGNPCDHCHRLQYSYTRNVSVNTIDGEEDDGFNPPGLGIASPSLSRRCDYKGVEDAWPSCSDSSESAVSVDSGSELISPTSPPPPILPASEPPELTSPMDSGVQDEGESSPRTPRKVDMKQPRGTRAYELSKAAAAKKMLLSEQKNTSNFSRSNSGYRSMRVTSKKGDSLAYITNKQASTSSSPPKAAATQPNQSNINSGLKGKVVIKKDQPAKPRPRLPQVPARAASASPRFTRRMPLIASSTPETKAEAVEAEDRLTPLPSEIAMARSWHPAPQIAYENPALDVETDHNPDDAQRGLVSDKVESLPGQEDEESTSSSSEESEESSDSESLEEGSYDANGNITNQCSVSTEMNSFELTKPLREACEIIHAKLTNEKANVTEEKLTWANQYMQHEWLKACARKQANPHVVEHFLDALESYSKALLHKVANMFDQNENTALHYGVSHGNYDIVSLLLDTKVCNLNRPNKAGYTPVMLAALCPIQGETEQMVVQRLFQMGDVNIKASQHGQTALMLAVSHGKLDNARLLIECGAGVNIQDEDGSTALMCAAEHGHSQLVNLLLAHPEIDASLTDFDGSTALSIAVENEHRDIGVLIYAHLNYARNSTAHHISSQSQTTSKSSTVST